MVSLSAGCGGHTEARKAEKRPGEQRCWNYNGGVNEEMSLT